MKRVLAVLTVNPDYIEFAVPQLKSILSKLKIPLSTLLSESEPLPEKHYDITHKCLKNFPHITLTIPDFQKFRTYFENASRKAVMVSKFILLISEGKNYQELLQNKDEDILNQECRDWNQLVVCDFNSRNRVIGREQQIKKIHSIFQKMDVRGKINIKNAQKRLQLVEDHKWYPGHHETGTEQTLQRVYFGIELSSAKASGRSKFNFKYQLSNRIYLGPTSTDNDLAFLMCNQGNVKDGSLVFDPFVGTGGLLIPPASYGAYTFGCDLDMRVLNGYAVGRINKKSPFYEKQKQLQIFTPKIYLNFDQYGFIRPCIFRMDSTRPAFRSFRFFDAIISDPPYGLRAMSRSTNKKSKKEEVKQKKQEQNYSDDNDDDCSDFEAQNEKVQQVPEEKKEEKNVSENENQNEESETKNNEEGESQEQKKKKLKKAQKKETRRKKREQMTEEEKQFKKDIVEKLNRERIDHWDKFDKAKVETTERQIIFAGLLNIARKYLKVGGRLVFLYPIYEEQEFIGVENLPNHEDFLVIDMSENILSKKNSRVLVTLEKMNHQSE